jgi:hypothetical protein
LFSDLIIAYSYGYIVLAILVGLLYAGILYVRNKKNKIGRLWTFILFIIRFLSVFLLAALLLSPYFKTNEKFVEKPIVVLGYDNSQSIVLGKDSVFYRTTFSQQWQNIPSLLGEDYNTEAHLFGSEVRKSDAPDNSDVSSDYSEFISHIKNDYKGMNLGAVVMAGDGIYNQGVEPVFAASGLSIPIFTIALGDTTAIKDIKITDVRYNSLVYKDDVFPVEVSISADQLKGKQAELIVSAFGEAQQKKKITIVNEDFSASYSFKLKAKKTGKHRIKIDILLNDEELNKSNNHSSIFVEVFNNAQKILILAYSPHPDVSAIHQSLKSFQQYDTDIKYIKDIKTVQLKDYNLLILHQVPSVFQRADQLMNEIKDLEIPVLYIIGKQSLLPVFNQQFKGMDILTSIGKFEEARPDINSLFTRFSYDIEYASQLEQLPPLISPLGNYAVSQNAEVFAYQRINGISTDFPLIIFYDESGVKNGAIAGEGIWMWRIHNYLNNGGFNAFDSFISKTIQYLSVKKDKRFFKVNTKNEYTRSENVIINAELYNDSYEAVNDAEVSLSLTDENGQQFNYLFTPEGVIYSLDLKQLDVGVYSYFAQTQLGKEQYETRGEFIVSGQSFESRNLQADHALLYRLASSGNGKMLYPEEITELPSLLAENNAIKKRTYFEEKLSGLNTMPLILIIILSLLSLEWFLRKYFGSY